MKSEPGVKELNWRTKPISGYARAFFSIVALAVVLGYLGRPPVQQLGTTGSGGERISLGSATEEELAQQDPEATAAEEAQASGASAATTGGGAGGKQAAAAKLECAPGRNGGRTDVGVSATKIQLATTAVLDGPAASLLRYSPTGMKAVMAKINSAGGICGRGLALQVVNDSFRADLGHQYIKNFLDSKSSIFVLPVVPSAEGLSSAIQSGDIDKAAMPVVGTDGMRIEQYDAKGKAEWVWPVASATTTTLRIMAEYGYKVRGARTFAIVWDGKYKFGVEGADAFKAQVEALGGDIRADTKLDPDQPSYASEVSDFNQESKCGNRNCDMVALLLLPDTAKNWLSRTPQMGRVYTAGAQTLFTDNFASGCVSAMKEACNGLAVWTGYNPPIGTYANLPGVSQYVNDVKRISPGIDTKNQFLEGAYLGMSVFVEALKRVGPNLTRAELKKVLDSMDYKTDLASDLSWRSGKHSANIRAKAFSLQVTQSTFIGWKDDNTGWIIDPKPGG